MSDMIVVMSEGVIQQQGGPEELYEHPVNRFVANFIGTSNPIPGKIVSVDAATRRAVIDSDRGLRLFGRVTALDATPASGDAVIVAIRPERLRIEPAETSVADDGSNAVEGIVRQGTYLGDQTEYRVETAQAGEMVVRRQNAAGADNGPGLGPGDRVVISWREEANLVLIN